MLIRYFLLLLLIQLQKVEVCTSIAPAEITRVMQLAYTSKRSEMKWKCNDFKCVRKPT